MTKNTTRLLLLLFVCFAVAGVFFYEGNSSNKVITIQQGAPAPPLSEWDAQEIELTDGKTAILYTLESENFVQRTVKSEFGLTEADFKLLNETAGTTDTFPPNR